MNDLGAVGRLRNFDPKPPGRALPPPKRLIEVIGYRVI